MVHIARIAIGSEVKEFEERDPIDKAWAFLDKHMARQEDEIAIVFENNYGCRVGEIWSNYVYWSHAETPGALRMYLNLCGFFDEPEGE